MLRALLIALVLTLSGVGCSTTPSVVGTSLSSPPAVCLEDCKNIPEHLGDDRAWMLEAVQVQTHCAVIQAACKGELVRRSISDTKGN